MQVSYCENQLANTFSPIIIDQLKFIAVILILFQGKLRGKLPKLKAIVQYTGKLVKQHQNVYDVSNIIAAAPQAADSWRTV